MTFILELAASQNTNKLSIIFLVNPNKSQSTQIMKLANFRVRDKITIKARQQTAAGDPKENPSQDQQTEHLPKDNELKLSLLLQSFENVISNLVTANTKNAAPSPKPIHDASPVIKQFDYRDRFVPVQIPNFDNSKIDEKKLEVWAGEVCHTSLSVSFHYLMEKKLNYDQMKAFACENFLRNLVILSDSCKMTSKDIAFIDQTMKQKIFPYLKAKYPLTVEKETNKSLSKVVQSIDNSEISTNDYFYTSEIEFDFRENGRYDDIIMRFINEIMTKVDSKANSNDETIFKKFKNVMSGVFTKTYDQQWMEIGFVSSKEIRNEETLKERQKYEEMVKSYTHFLIGRKISENTHLYTEEEINSRNMEIKSSTVLRILTKWCEELWQKFNDENYYIKRSDGFLIFSTKKIGVLNPKVKQKLTTRSLEQKRRIEKFMQEVEKINYEQQIELMQAELSNEEDGYIERNQRATGKFAYKNANLIESFIIDYLNLLIHSLIKVSINCYDQFQHFSPELWEKRFNLVTFRVSDLIRCKFASKEKEVLKVFNEITKISDENPELLKIVRIKNRLQTVTNDIMVNAKFNNSILCEIQIAVNPNHSEFIDCSNKINHYIYELERAQFGPILQMCSIWKIHEKRAEVFKTLILKQKPRRKPGISHEQCLKNQQYSPENSISNPFICSQCSRHIYRNCQFLSHTKCQICNYCKCAKCEIKFRYENQDRHFFFDNSSLRDQFIFMKTKNQIPETGASIFINNSLINIDIFRTVSYDSKSFLITLKNNKLSILREIGSKRDRDKLFNDFIIFQLPEKIVDEIFQLESVAFEENAKVKLLIPNFIQKCLKEEKQSISIMGDPSLSKVNFEKVVSKHREKCKSIKNLQFYGTNLPNLDNLLPDFVNLTRLNLSQNKITDIRRVCEFSKLEKLDINDNQITSLPADINKLSRLEECKAYCNQLTSLPETFCELGNLKFVNLDDNQLIRLPENLDSLTNLIELSLTNNQIECFPEALEKLPKLTVLSFYGNKIQTLPQHLKGFGALKTLNMEENSIKELPESMAGMVNLTELKLRRNNLQQIPVSIRDLKSLKKLVVESNKLTKIADQIGELKQLTHLNISSNELVSLNSAIFKLTNLTHLNFQGNKIEQLEELFDQLPNLYELRIRSNQLKKFPKSLSNRSLSLYYRPNPFEEFDMPYYFQMNEVRREIQINNWQGLKRISCSKMIFDPNSVTKASICFNKTLEEFPHFIGALKRLERLNFQKNAIHVIPDIFAQLNALQFFTINHNFLQKLPPSFVNLSALKRLDLTHNPLKVFPKEIFSLQNLQGLFLEECDLEELPPEIGCLKMLKLLHVNKNNISSIPQEIEQMESLQAFRIVSNKIKNIPLGLIKNKKIQHVWMECNFIQKIPVQINQMSGMIDKRSSIAQNPIKQVGDPIFMAKKFKDWKKVQAQMSNKQTQ